MRSAIAVVRSVYDALGRGDLESATACLSPNVEWHEPGCVPWGGRSQGHDGFRWVVEAIATSTDEPRVRS